MDLFRLRSTGPEAGDCTAPYDVIFNRECTVREFVDEVLKKKEWGIIFIGSRYSGSPRISYSGDKLKSSAFPDDILDKTIQSATSRGGWTNMDYILHIWSDKEKIRFEYAETLKNIVKLESEMTKLRIKAAKLEDQMKKEEEKDERENGIY